MYNTIADLQRRFGTDFVSIPAGVYNINKCSTLKENQTITGAGKNKTKTTGTIAFDYVFYIENIKNGKLKDINFNLLNITAGSAVAFVDCDYCKLENCLFSRGAINGWQAKFTDSDYNNKSYSNSVVDCDFINHNGTLEALLVANQIDFKVKNCYFSQKIGSTFPQLGLWEQVNNSLVEDCIFEDSSLPLYYSISCNDLTFKNLIFNNTGRILGCNISDNGTHNFNYSENLTFEKLTFNGGDLSKNDYALQLGAVKNSLVKNVDINGHQGGVKFSKANNNNITTDQSQNIDLYNINCKATTHLNPQAISNAFYFSEGNNWNINIYGGVIDGFQFPISLNGSGSHTNIKFYNVTFKNYTQLVRLNDGQTDSSGVQFIDCIT